MLARDTTFAMTGVESFLNEEGPEEEAGAIERFAGQSEQNKNNISKKIIYKTAFLKQHPPSRFLSQ